MNWPGFAFLAMSGASMTIFVTVGFSATFSVILYIAVAPFSGKISAQKHVCPPARHSRRVFVQLFDKFIITFLRRERNRIFFVSAAAKLKQRMVSTCTKKRKQTSMCSFAAVHGGLLSSKKSGFRRFCKSNGMVNDTQNLLNL